MIWSSLYCFRANSINSGEIKDTKASDNMVQNHAKRFSIAKYSDFILVELIDFVFKYLHVHFGKDVFANYIFDFGM